MLKSCPSNDELRSLVDEQLSVERTRQLNAHLPGCTRCGQRVERLQALLVTIKAPAAAATAADAQHFKREILSALGDSRPSKRRRQWPFAIAAAAVATAAITLVIVAPFDDGETGRFAARGAVETSSLSAVAAVDVLLSRRPLRAGDRLGPGHRLAFRVRNISDQPLYLLAFAIDAAGEVHWFYPAYTDPSKDPPATQLAPGTRDRMLPDVVEPEGCAAGPLEVLTVISRKARTVKQVERSLAATRREVAPIAKTFTGDLLRSWSVRWQPNRAEP